MQVISESSSNKTLMAGASGPGARHAPPVGEVSAPAQPIGSIAESQVRHINVADIDLEDTTYLFRADIRVGPLLRSIATEGMQLPIIVRPRSNGTYQLISGFRRVAAIRELDWPHVSAIVRTDLDDDEDAFKAAVLENLFRRTYSDIDRALVIRAYRRRGHTTQQIGEVLGLRERQVQNIQRLLELPVIAQAAIADPNVAFEATHALTFKRLTSSDVVLDWAEWIRRCNDGGWSVSRLRCEVTKAQQSDEAEFAPVRVLNPTQTRLDQGIIRFRPIKVEIKNLSVPQRDALRAELQAVLHALET